MPAPTLRKPLVPPATNGARPPVSAGPTSAKRSAPMALAGLTAVVLGALVFAGLHVSLDRRRSVVVVARPVAAGSLITAGDLSVVKASVEPSMAVPAARRGEVVGKAAAVTLLPGSLLAPGQVGVSSSLQAGEAIVGLALKTGQFPSALRAGSRVEVIDTGGSSGQSDRVRPVLLSASAVVAAVGRPEASTGTMSLSITVREPEAASVAAAGAAGRASLVVLPSP